MARSVARTPVPSREHEAEHPPPLPESLLVWPGFLLAQAAQSVQRHAESLFEPQWFTLRHFGVLTVIHDEPGLSQRRIGAAVRIDRTTIVAIVDDLETAGLIERRRGPDRRSYELHVTALGVKRLRELRKDVIALHEELLAGLTPDQRAMMAALLRLMLQQPARGDAELLKGVG
jgi:DNA-binding MarR family transcriptional regulator